MLTNCIFLIPVKSKSTEEVIKAYPKDVYSKFGGSKYILNNKGDEFKQFMWLTQK